MWAGEGENGFESVERARSYVPEDDTERRDAEGPQCTLYLGMRGSRYPWHNPVRRPIANLVHAKDDGRVVEHDQLRGRADCTRCPLSASAHRRHAEFLKLVYTREPKRPLECLKCVESY